MEDDLKQTEAAEEGLDEQCGQQSPLQYATPVLLMINGSFYSAGVTSASTAITGVALSFAVPLMIALCYGLENREREHKRKLNEELGRRERQEQQERTRDAILEALRAEHRRREEERLRASVNPASYGPYAVLGVSPQATDQIIKAAYRKLARESHPDILAARGATGGSLRAAHNRMVALNTAMAEIDKQRERTRR